MDLHEAFERLGVEPTERTADVRRAYLRLVKKHKPETDPEGFQRIRQAWERVRAASEWELRGACGATSAATEEGPRGDDPAETPAEPRGAGENADDPAPPEAPHLDELYARAAHAAPAERLALAREVVASHPDDADSHWFLYDALDGDGAGAADVLRDAHRRGLPGFFDALVRLHPEELTDDELALARDAAGRSVDPLALATALLRRGDPDGAAQVVGGLLDAARDGGDGPPAAWMVHFLLELYAADRPPAATGLFDRWSKWRREVGRDLELSVSHVMGDYVLLAELAALRTGFPHALRAAFARAILRGDLTAIKTHVAKWSLRHAIQAPTLERRLRADAPNLHGAAYPFDWRAAAKYALYVAVFVSLHLLRMLYGHEPAHGPPTTRLQRIPAVPRAVANLCSVEAASDVCLAARAVAAHLDEGACDDAHAELARLDAALGALRPSMATQEVSRLSYARRGLVAAWRQCIADRRASPHQDPPDGEPDEPVGDPESPESRL